MTNIETVYDVEEFKSALGKMKSRLATDDILEEIANIVTEDDSLDGHLQDKIVSFSSVMKTGRYKSLDYVKAVQFCSYLSIGDTQIDAYRKTFPKRAAAKTQNSLQSGASIYASGDLVQKIMAQSMVPVHIMFNSERFKAINILSELMTNSDNERIRMESADKMLGHIKPPEESKLTLDIGIKDDESIRDLNDALTQLALKEKEMLDKGMITLKDVAKKKIVRDEEVIDVVPE